MALCVLPNPVSSTREMPSATSTALWPLSINASPSAPRIEPRNIQKPSSQGYLVPASRLIQVPCFCGSIDARYPRLKLDVATRYEREQSNNQLQNRVYIREPGYPPSSPRVSKQRSDHRQRTHEIRDAGMSPKRLSFSL
jgi:hypothetical protein